MISESEWLTRKKRIDGRLTVLGWRIVRHSEGISLGSLDKVAVEELPTASGPADYALFVSGKLLGIIEAKKVTVNPQNVLEQAKRYAEGAFNGVGNWGGLRVPFLYASNGESSGTWTSDLQSVFRDNLRAFTHRKPYSGYSTKTPLLPSTGSSRRRQSGLSGSGLISGPAT
jgi:type I site-specific restriction endonuclease